MDIESAVRQYLNLKNRLIPSTETEIYILKRSIPKKVKSLKKIKNASTNIEDFEWAIRTRGFTIFNLFSLTSYIVFFIFSIILTIVLFVSAFVILIVEALLDSQNFEFEHSMIYKPIEFLDSIIADPSQLLIPIPMWSIPIVLILIVLWIVYSFAQVKRNRKYYEDVVIPQNMFDNAQKPAERQKVQEELNQVNLKLQNAEDRLKRYKSQLHSLRNSINIPDRYFQDDAFLRFILQKFEYGQARTLGEALNLLEREEQTIRIEIAQRKAAEETRRASERRERQHAETMKEMEKNTEELRKQNERAERWERHFW